MSELSNGGKAYQRRQKLGVRPAVKVIRSVSEDEGSRTILPIKSAVHSPLLTLRVTCLRARANTVQSSMTMDLRKVLVGCG